LLEDSGIGKQALHQGHSEDVHELLTWKLTVHFKDYPNDILVPLDEDGKVLRDAFSNAVKEVSYISTEEAWRC
jgi:autophagy-related protein 5